MIRQMLLAAGAEVTAGRYPFHQRIKVDVAAAAPQVFGILDNHRRLAAHMEKPSIMMAGATMHGATDTLNGRSVSSLINVRTLILGVNLAGDEVVTERIPPLCKICETQGEPRLLVIGSYLMGFTISDRGNRSRLAVFIHYQLPRNGFPRVFGLIFGGVYAAWCTRRLATDALSACSDVAIMQLEHHG